MRRVLTRKKPGRNIELYYVDSLTGKERTKSSGTRDQRIADRRAQDWERDLETEIPSKGMAWTPAVAKYRAHAKPNIAPETFRFYMLGLRRFEELIGTPRNLSSVTTLVLDDFVSKYRAKYPTATERTIGARLKAIRVFLRWCESRGIISKSPMVPMPKGAHDAADGNPITREQFEQLKAMMPPRWGTFLEGMWLGGFRPSEAILLHWTKGPVRLHWDGPRSYIHFDPEGHKARRHADMPLPADFIAFLGGLPSRTGYVLDPPVKDPDDVSRTFGRRLGALGFRVVPKDLRKSFATRLALVVDPIELQAMMRHRKFETTLKHYAKPTIDRMQESVFSKSAPVHAPKVDAEKKTTTRKRAKKAG